jgi:hypothetical protein
LKIIFKQNGVVDLRKDDRVAQTRVTMGKTETISALKAIL